MIGAIRPVTFGGGDVELLATFDSSYNSGEFSIVTPAQTKHFIIKMWGGGGGGGGSGLAIGPRYFAAVGGGGAAFVEHKLQPAGLRPGDVLFFTVGARGIAGSLNASGNAGGDTTVDRLVRDLNGINEQVIKTFSGVNAGGGAGGTRLNTALGAFALGGVARGGNIQNINGNQGNSSSGLGTIGGDGGDPPFSTSGFFVQSGDGSGVNPSGFFFADGLNFGGGGGGAHGDISSSLPTHGGRGGVGRVQVEAYG